MDCPPRHRPTDADGVSAGDKAVGVDLTTQIGMATKIEGALSFVGAPAGYRGRFAISNTNPGW